MGKRRCAGVDGGKSAFFWDNSLIQLSPEEASVDSIVSIDVDLVVSGRKAESKPCVCPI